MRIATISDIHIDINREYPVIDELIKVCQSKKVDVLIIAGDISNHYEQTIQAIDKLDSLLDADIYYVAGNHDLWHSESHVSSQAIYEAYSNDPRNLAGKTIHLNEQWALIGDIGWFDYSFGNDDFSKVDFDKMSYNERNWQDKRYNTWCRDNLATSQRFIEQIEKRLTSAKDKHIIFVTHMIGHRYFAVPEKRVEWRYFNAFLGSEALGQLALKHQVKHHIMGHVHYRKTLEEQGVLSICACLNYVSQWYSKDVVKEITEALYVFEI